ACGRRRWSRSRAPSPSVRSRAPIARSRSFTPSRVANDWTGIRSTKPRSASSSSARAGRPPRWRTSSTRPRPPEATRSGASSKRARPRAALPLRACRAEDGAMAELQEWLYRITPARLGMLTDGPTDAENEAVAAHFAYLQKLLAEGVLVLAG